MPIYEYQCPNCQFVDEVLVKSTKSHKPKCPACGQSKMEKIMSASNFSLKGRNWSRDSYGLKKKEKKK